MSNISAADPVRVLVVDDSAVIRGLLTRALEADPEVRVVASVGNGQMAVGAVERQVIDVVVLDIEMPVMDGLTALPKIIAAAPGIKVIMASTLTVKNAEVSLKALQAGAADYLGKPTSTRELGGAADFSRDLLAKVKALGAVARATPGRGPRKSLGPASVVASLADRRAAPKAITLKSAPLRTPEVIAIGSSTGGPQALFEVLAHLGTSIAQPILITQHMPATFTTILAEHIQRQCRIVCAEAKDGEPVTGGRVYLAPGDFHMSVVVQGSKPVIGLNKNPPENFCRPAADPMLRSLAAQYGRGVLAVILTGMGQDGLRGCEAVVASGGAVIAQDEASSVVWGMPGAVAVAGLCSQVLPLKEIGPAIRRVAARSAA